MVVLERCQLSWQRGIQVDIAGTQPDLTLQLIPTPRPRSGLLVRGEPR
jgi:hypothetical protein